MTDNLSGLASALSVTEWVRRLQWKLLRTAMMKLAAESRRSVQPDCMHALFYSHSVIAFRKKKNLWKFNPKSFLEAYFHEIFITSVLPFMELPRDVLAWLLVLIWFVPFPSCPPVVESAWQTNSRYSTLLFFCSLVRHPLRSGSPSPQRLFSYIIVPSGVHWSLGAFLPQRLGGLIVKTLTV